MTRAQFLNSLYRRLGALSQEQAEQHLTYYAEMLADRMEEGMSEEEAVASMEDLDTIAQRILQDEGITGIHPPRAPGLPERPATPGQEGRAGKPARDWRKFASIALWAAAIALVVSVVANRLNDRRVRGITAVDSSSSEPDFSMGPGGIRYTDGETSVRLDPGGIQVQDGETEVYIGPGGIRVKDGEAVEEPEALEELDVWWANGYDYAGTQYVMTDGITKVNVDWIGGEVMIQPCDSGKIQFCEYATKQLTGETQMTYEVDGDTLTIHYWKGSHKNERCTKQLVLEVPERLLEELYVDTVSANVWIEGLQVRDRLTVDTTSGDMNLTQVDSRFLQADTTSGGVFFSDVTAAELETSATSGDVSLLDVTADKLEASTVSGSVFGSIAAGEVQVDTTSGYVSLETRDGRDFEVGTLSGEVYLSVTEADEISVDTTSGSVILAFFRDMGFSLEFETTSGTLETGGYSVARNNGRYVYGDGSCEIEVETVSGDLIIS